MVAMEAAVLLEAGWDMHVDEVWCLIAPPEAQVSRVMERNQLSRAAAEARIAAQMGNEERVRRSHVVLMSRECPEETAATVVLRRGGRPSGARERTIAPPRRGLRSRSMQTPLRRYASGSPRSSRRAWTAWAVWSPQRMTRSLIARASGGVSCTTGTARRAVTTTTWKHIRDFHTQHRRSKAAGALQAPVLCELALFFHDAVYDAARADNELQSAQLFTEFCADLRRAARDSGTELPPSLHLEQATGLILRTANHMDGPPADGDAAAFLDCDLHTLGASPPVYHRYAEGVRLEYAHVGEAGYRARRTAVLRLFSTRMPTCTSRRRCATSERPRHAPTSPRRSGVWLRRADRVGPRASRWQGGGERREH